MTVATAPTLHDLAHTPFAMARCDASGHLLAASPAFEHHLALPPDEADGRPLCEALGWAQGLPATITWQLAMSPAGDGKAFSVCGPSGQGARHAIRLHAQPDTASRAAQPSGWHVLLTAPDEALEAGEATRVAEERLRLAVDVARIALWDWDLAHDAIFLNAQWAMMVGRPPRAYTATARELAERMHPQDAERIRRAIANALQGNDTCEAVYRIRTEQGSYRWVRSQGRVVQRGADGQALRMIGMYIDITDSQQAQAALRQARDEAQQADRAKAAFIDRMSHELRTPLNTVVGMSHLLSQSTLDDRQARWVSAIGSASRDLLRQIADVIEFSRLARGAAAAQQQRFDPAQLASQVLARAERDRRDAGAVSTRLVLEPCLPTPLIGDAERIDQILYHLLSNALKFTDEGQVTLSLGVDNEAPKRPPVLRLVVQDTGIGMDTAQMGRLFSAFEQGDGGTTRGYDGAGLGLALVHESVRLLGGDIRVDSQPGLGTRVDVLLPVSV